MIAKKYKPEIQQIHDESKTAFTELLKEAKKLIDKTIESKAERLEKIGFESSPEVEEGKKAKKARELKELIEHYRFYYPQNPFINEKKVNEICEKYNLYLGAIMNYIGYVPEFALEEIEKFKIREEDLPEKKSIINGFSNRKLITVEMYLTDLTMERDMVDTGGNFLISGRNRAIITGELANPLEMVTETDRNLQIIAPEKDFKFQNKFKSGRKLIEDPIVLQPVKEGYLIVTAWGDESKEVDNSTKN